MWPAGSVFKSHRQYGDIRPECGSGHHPAPAHDRQRHGDAHQQKQFEELQTVEGKEALRTEAFAEINALLEKETHKKNGITQVLFSEFVLQ